MSELEIQSIVNTRKYNNYVFIYGFNKFNDLNINLCEINEMKRVVSDADNVVIKDISVSFENKKIMTKNLEK